MNKFWNAEPALILGVVNAAIALGVGFGLNVTAQQGALINAFVTSVLMFVTRSQVTSSASLEAMKPADLAKAQNTSEPVQSIVQKLPTKEG